jgi:broad specificity phosphatase PhoE
MSGTDTSPHLRLYLIRHGEIEPAAMGKLIGQTDVALSSKFPGKNEKSHRRMLIGFAPWKSVSNAIRTAKPQSG